MLLYRLGWGPLSRMHSSASTVAAQEAATPRRLQTSSEVAQHVSSPFGFDRCAVALHTARRYVCNRDPSCLSVVLPARRGISKLHACSCSPLHCPVAYSTVCSLHNSMLPQPFCPA